MHANRPGHERAEEHVVGHHAMIQYGDGLGSHRVAKGVWRESGAATGVLATMELVAAFIGLPSMAEKARRRLSGGQRRLFAAGSDGGGSRKTC